MCLLPHRWSHQGCGLAYSRPWVGRVYGWWGDDMVLGSLQWGFMLDKLQELTGVSNIEHTSRYGRH